jgi:DNA-binding LytR/AlgR family response regulator
MIEKAKIRSENKFPQNLILKNPATGSLIIFIFCLTFMLIYRPLGTHPGRYFGYEVTMAVYSIISAISAYGAIILLKRIRHFSDENEWTLGKELAAIFITLTTVGLAVYLAGFIVEEPENRLNFPTLLNSVKNTFLAGLIPFGFFVLANYRQWFSESEYVPVADNKEITEAPKKELIKITSQLKKEELNFYPEELVYLTSEGNYVNFFLLRENKIKKFVIRNSINNIEQQLSGIPYFSRTHRAFIVNMKKIITLKGNSLGYRLRLIGIDEEIPVSRNQSKQFRQFFREFQ